ncbi:MipA/OmpV family protein [Thaumasiovibrio subtropicus]|uniref:MipA/OmpV family protein n=1 Tax=Thaumasiovibrio subtropicus TaxID=1891207 RepID=UPI00131C7BBE|nr:MipA/OmpV family protein [Thaumasiovibrio subtropicus]
MKPLKSTIICLSVLLLPLLPSVASADDVILEPVWVEEEKSLYWDLSLGVNVYQHQDIYAGFDSDMTGFNFNLNLSVEYKNFYLQAERSQIPNGANLGYHLYERINYGIDLVAGVYQPGTAGDERTDIPHEQRHHRREADLSAGVRFYGGNDYVDYYLDVVRDISDTHSGWIARSMVSTDIPAGNWEVRAGLGVDIYFSKTANYTFGVLDSEVNPSRPAYQPGTTAGYYFAIHADYPLSANWVFDAGFLVGGYSDNVADSPIVNRQYRTSSFVGLRYVF